MKRITLIICLLLSLSFSSCYDRKGFDEIRITESTITFIFSITPEILDYVDITAVYYDMNGDLAKVPMHSPAITANTFLDNFAMGEHLFDKQLAFLITRKGTKLPAEPLHVTAAIDVEVNSLHPDGTIQTESESGTTDFGTVDADNFDTWLTSFAARMQVGYYVFVRANGSVNFSLN